MILVVPINVFPDGLLELGHIGQVRALELFAQDEVLMLRPRSWSHEGQLGPVHTIFARCVAIKKGQAQGAKRSWGATPARLGNAANGPF